MCLQWLLFVVPFFHLGQALFDLYTYNYCVCLVCTFDTIAAIRTYLGIQYTFSLGRLCALLLCFIVISTGAGTIRKGLLLRNWFVVLGVFGGFVAAQALSFPLAAYKHGINSAAAFYATIVLYAVLFASILYDSWSNARVLKAQLLMIRAQGIEPRTCPAYAKFKLFNSLRRYILIFFVIHTFIIVSQVFNLSQAASVALLVLWELLQLVVTFVIGWLFKASSSTTNLYLDREDHLPSSQVTHHVRADEVSLSLDDLDSVAPDDRAPEGGASTPLLPWAPTTAVPAPPALPPMIEVFRAGAPRRFIKRRHQAAAAPPTPPSWTPPSSQSPEGSVNSTERLHTSTRLQDLEMTGASIAARSNLPSPGIC